MIDANSEFIYSYQPQLGVIHRVLSLHELTTNLTSDMHAMRQNHTVIKSM